MSGLLILSFRVFPVNRKTDRAVLYRCGNLYTEKNGPSFGKVPIGSSKGTQGTCLNPVHLYGSTVPSTLSLTDMEVGDSVGDVQTVPSFFYLHLPSVTFQCHHGRRERVSFTEGREKQVELRKVNIAP